MTPVAILTVAVLTVVFLVVVEGSARVAGCAYRKWRTAHRPPNPPEPEDWL